MKTKSPKIMTARYPGKCDRCGRHVEAGETITWITRGVIECRHCTTGTASAVPVTGKFAPDANGSDADAWATAMSWDSAPEPGASITPKKRRVKRPQKPAAAKKADTVPVVVSQAPTDAERKIIDARMIAAGHDAPAARETVTGRSKAAETVVAASDETPEADAVARMISDQLALLVNALDQATAEQRQAVRAYAEKFAVDSVAPSRARIWHALATAAIS